MQDIPTSSPYRMIPMHEALSQIATTLQALPPEEVPTPASLHRILTTDIHAPTPHPPFRASIKDGYAIKLPPSIDDTTCLTVRAESHAGSDKDPTIKPGEAVYVTTGAPVPVDADAVVMVEDCVRNGDSLAVSQWPAVGTDVREIGSDLQKGQLVLPKGTFIGAAEVGLLAACAVTRVSVAARPIIGVISTGDEIVNLADIPSHAANEDSALPFGQIVDSNRPMLLAAIQESLPFCTPLDLGIVRDDYDVVKANLQSAIEKCHMVITSGGVSMGRRDVVKPILSEIGKVHFGRVIMKPGKPLTFATLRERPADRCFVALPGNPVSCFVCFHLAVAVAARKLAGWDTEASLGSTVDVELGHDVKLDPQRPEYHRAVLQWVDGRGYVGTSTGKQASSRLLSARSANALLALPTGDGKLSAGTKVKGHLLTSWGYSKAQN